MANEFQKFSSCYDCKNGIVITGVPFDDSAVFLFACVITKKPAAWADAEAITDNGDAVAASPLTQAGDVVQAVYLCEQFDVWSMEYHKHTAWKGSGEYYLLVYAGTVFELRYYTTKHRVQVPGTVVWNEFERLYMAQR